MQDAIQPVPATPSGVARIQEMICCKKNAAAKTYETKQNELENSELPIGQTQAWDGGDGFGRRAGDRRSGVEIDGCRLRRWKLIVAGERLGID